MAKLKKIAGEYNQFFEDVSGLPVVRETVGYGQKALRLKILYDRTQKRDVNTQDEHRAQMEKIITEGSASTTLDTNPTKPYKDDIENSRKSRGNTPPESSKYYKDKVTIINLDAGNYPGELKYDKLTLPFIPTELNYNSESNFVAIATMGRNNPHYQYTGAEDTLEFVIDWFSTVNTRDDVIHNCRWVEALSKNNAYTNRPPRIKIQWGELDKLFANHIWIVSNAPYRLNNFQAAYYDRDANFKKTGELIKIGSLPQQAFQTVTLKRVTSGNLSTKDIIDNLGFNRE